MRGEGTQEIKVQEAILCRAWVVDEMWTETLGQLIDVRNVMFGLCLSPVPRWQVAVPFFCPWGGSWCRSLS